MALIDLKNAEISLYDGSTHHIVIEVGDGTCDYTEKRSVEAVKRRGELDTVRLGDEELMDVSFQFVWETVSADGSGVPSTIEDVLKHRKNAAAWVSTSTDPDAPFCVDVTIKITPLCGEPVQTYWLREFHYTELAHAIADATIDCTGQCNRVEADFIIS